MYEQIEELLYKLAEKTKGKSITWKKGAVNTVFFSHFSKATVKIASVRSYISLEVLNSDGDQIERIHEADLSESLKNLLYDIYNMARAEALDIDKTMESLLDDLY